MVARYYKACQYLFKYIGVRARLGMTLILTLFDLG